MEVVRRADNGKWERKAYPRLAAGTKPADLIRTYSNHAFLCLLGFYYWMAPDRLRSLTLSLSTAEIHSGWLLQHSTGVWYKEPMLRHNPGPLAFATFTHSKHGKE